MDTTLFAALIGGLVGLVGSVIGGVASYLGSHKAAKQGIEAQREFDRVEKQERIKSNAAAIRLDFITAITELIRVHRGVVRPGIGLFANSFSISSNPSDAIASLHEHFSQDELYRIKKLYGYIETYNKIASVPSMYNSNMDECKHIALAFLSELWRDKYSAIIEQTDPDVLRFELISHHLHFDYQKIFGKLQNI